MKCKKCNRPITTEIKRRVVGGFIHAVCPIPTPNKRTPDTEPEALERWMREVTDMLCYSPDNPMDYKTGLVAAFANYRKIIGKPLKK